jgi:Xaa-Pro aminopeptidase
MSRIAAALFLALFAVSIPAHAQIAPPEYAARRDTVAAHLRDGTLVAFGATTPTTDEADFHQLPSFSYLTGYSRMDAAFVMLVRQGRPVFQMLYEPPTDPRLALYNGFRPDSARLVRTLGLGLGQMEALEPLLDSAATRGTLFTVSDVHTRDALEDDSLTRGRRFEQQFRSSHPDATVQSADALLDSLRVRKSPAEIALIRKAVAISVLGERAAMRRARPGTNEGEIHALSDYTFRSAGASGPSFRAIIGSGPNSTSYHYRANDRVMQAGEVVVMDMGALYQGYAGDVTRTVPVSGRFSPDQAAVYRIVRGAQAAAERLAKPGASVAAGDSAARAVEARELARLGLIESPEATFDPPWADSATCARVPVPVKCRQAFLYRAHGLGHGIGLEVHDAGGYSYSPTGRFHVGEPFTIEPGIYISTALLDMLADTPKNRAFIAKVRPAVERYNHIGIRIEDNYLITADGVEWLSRMPRELGDVEAAMKPGAAPRATR